MDLSAIYSKTPKGLRARASLIGGLSSHLMKVLTHVDGTNRAENIIDRFEKLSEKQLSADLTQLEQEGYIRLTTVGTEADEGWALTTNFEPMQVEEYQSQDELEADAQANAAEIDQQKALDQALEEQQRLAAAAKAEKKVKNSRDRKELKAPVDLQAQPLSERQQQDLENLKNQEKYRLEEVVKADEAAQLSRQKLEAVEKVKQHARAEVERIKRESEDAQKKQELKLKAKLEVERLGALRLAEEAAAEKAEQDKLENEKAEQEKLAKEQARLDAANALRKVEEEKQQQALQAKAEKLEAKRKMKAEQEERLQQERNAKVVAKDLQRQQKLQAQAELKAKLQAIEQARLVQDNIAKVAEKAAKETAEQAAAEEAERSRIEQQAVNLALAKQVAEEQAAITAKENTRLEMERIAEEAGLARQITAAQTQALESEKTLSSFNDFDAVEAGEEAAFAAEEEIAEAEKKIKHAAEHTSKKAAEEENRAEIKNAAISQAEAMASVHGQSSLLPTKKIKQWLRSLSRLTFVYMPLLLLVLVLLAHFINLSTLIQPIEKIASENIGKPVSIDKVYASLWPQPSLVLEQVAIGDSRIKAVHVLPVATSLFEETKLVKSLVIDGLSLNQSNFSEAIVWAGNLGRAKNIKNAQINLKNLTLAIHDLQLESFDGKVSLKEAGGLNSIDLVSSNNALSLAIAPQGADYAIDLKAANWQLPFNQKLMFSSLNAKGLASGNQIRFSQIAGEIYGGNLTGQINIQWPESNGQWKTTGDFKLEKAYAEQLLSTFGSAVIVDGKLALNGSFASQASTASQLAEASAVRANFDVRQGDIQGIELSRAVMSRGQSLAGDSTQFDKLTGTVQANKGQYQFSKLQLNSPQLNANGYINIAADNALTGNVTADLAAQSRRLQAKFAVSGSGKDLKSN